MRIFTDINLLKGRGDYQLPDKWQVFVLKKNSRLPETRIGVLLDA
jgi:hypothetical protein